MMSKLLVFILVLISLGINAQISIIGPASPSGNWTTDHDLTETSTGSGIWTATLALNVGELKFRHNHDWASNWGATSFPSGIAVLNGSNIPVNPAGTYYITFNATTLAYSFAVPSSGNVGVGTTSPTEKLDVVGNIKTSGEIKPNGASGLANQVLASNGDGTMQWAAMSNGEENTGSGNWGDCTVNNITAFQPVSDENGAINDYFGGSVSISGDYAIVGAYSDDEGGLINNGSATIFKRNASSGIWESQGKLTNPGAENDDYFGGSVSISGDYAIVGAYGDDEGGLIDNGSATIFKRNASSGLWESQGKLTNPGAESDDYFGTSVSISGDYAIVGANYDDEGGLVLNGSATIFKRNASTGIWESQGKLTNPGAENGDWFGYRVSISGDYAIVGASLDDEGGLIDNGLATIFRRNASSGIWESQGKLINQGAASDDGFGASVSISGDYAIVGARLDDEGSLANNGSATIFKRNPSTGAWGWQGKFTNPGAANNDQFGWSVSISGDYAIVGALWDDEGGLIDNGSATVFCRYGNIWRVIQKFTHPDSDNYNYFGVVSIEGTTRRFLVGALGVQNSTGMAFFGKVK